MRVEKTRRVTFALVALSLIPATWFIARNGSGNFPLSSVLATLCLALAVGVWLIPRPDARVWAIGFTSLSMLAMGLSLLRVVRLPSTALVVLVVSAIVTTLVTSRRPGGTSP